MTIRTRDVGPLLSRRSWTGTYGSSPIDNKGFPRRGWLKVIGTPHIYTVIGACDVVYANLQACVAGNFLLGLLATSYGCIRYQATLAWS
jgi:hypothetical protein